MLTPKTRFCRLKEYFIAEKLFTVETSIFVEKKLYKFRFLFGGKDHFVIKNTSVNTENEVLSSKRVLYSWKTIYGGTSIILEKKLYKFRFLFGGKDRSVIKNTSVNTENEVLPSKRVLYSWKTILRWKPRFL